MPIMAVGRVQSILVLEASRFEERSWLAASSHNLPILQHIFAGPNFVQLVQKLRNHPVALIVVNNVLIAQQTKDLALANVHKERVLLLTKVLRRVASRVLSMAGEDVA